MEKNLEQELIDKYPILYGFSEDVHEPFGYYETHFQHGDGWYNIIDKISQQLEFLNKQPLGLKIQATQVKEKFGTLRFYFSLTGDSTLDEEVFSGWHRIVQSIIREAEVQSQYHCEICGEWEDAKLYSSGWWRTLCPAHAKELGKVKDEGD